jgi:hypothetical protein
VEALIYTNYVKPPYPLVAGERPQVISCQKATWPAAIRARPSERSPGGHLNQHAIDTTTPMGKLVFQVTGACSGTAGRKI